MSGGAGHIFSMIASLKHNKRNRKNLFDRDVHRLTEGNWEIIDNKKMSSLEFEAFKQNLKKNELQRQKKLGITFLSIMFIIVGILFYFLFYY